MKTNISILLHFVFLILYCPFSFGQKATISIEKRMLKTYDFGEPNPVPILVENAKIYPYFKFEGYSHEAKEKEWEVVKLENQYITVYILPEIGGKIWGAIEKKTGEEFLYRNEVVKFRNIAMRGPWTSGGIEFNFGIIGHSPATATPVDYRIEEHENGSVSCTVGAIDLPSRSQWRVEIKLESDKAFFETNSSWYNPTLLNQSYYNWMTGAAAASEDLEFFIPGNQYLEHGGNTNPWPINQEGRNLSFYSNNDFGSHKSYHIVGKYKDFFGGYYHKKKFGFGHWARYEEMPGQKLWLWALSRSGGIWEDLLTDTDGQYIEFQAGRLFNQYSPENGDNSITQANFEPHVMDRWREIWFPFKEIGGMSEVSEWCVLNVEDEKDTTTIGINALQPINELITVSVNGVIVMQERLELKPMDTFIKQFPRAKGDLLEISVGNGKMFYSSETDHSLLSRPFHSVERKRLNDVDQTFFSASESIKFRDYNRAREKLSFVLSENPLHLNALLQLSELEFRSGRYISALEKATQVLKIDTYHPEANYLAGIAYQALDDDVNALESLGWAARSIKFRSTAYAQMAVIFLKSRNWQQSKILAEKALDFNKFNIKARNILAVIARLTQSKDDHEQQTSKILHFDVLNHFAENERLLLASNIEDSISRNYEIPAETNLELALEYYELGQEEEAIAILEKMNDVKNQIWLAYLLRDRDSIQSKQIISGVLQKKIDFVFPFRRESLEIFKWASTSISHWKVNYYLALNYFALGEYTLGNQILLKLGQNPDSPVFYRFRAQMLRDESIKLKLADYEKALNMDEGDWKTWEEAIQLNLSAGEHVYSMKLAAKAAQLFPHNFNIGLVHSKSLIENGEYEKSIAILEKLHVMPSELGRVSRRFYFESHVLLAEQYFRQGNHKRALELLAASRDWPENLGVGKPYLVDERLQDYMAGLIYTSMGDQERAIESWKRVVDFSEENKASKGKFEVLYLLSMQRLGMKQALEKAIAELEASKSKADQYTLSLYQRDFPPDGKRNDKITLLLIRLLEY